MLNAIQGKSIFAGPEESIFSSTDAEKTNIQTKLHSKLAQKDGPRGLNSRSMQKVNSSALESNAIFGEFMHQPFWMNQSQVIYETNHAQSQLQDVVGGSGGVTTNAPLTTKASRKISELRQP